MIIDFVVKESKLYDRHASENVIFHVSQKSNFCFYFKQFILYVMNVHSFKSFVRKNLEFKQFICDERSLV